MLRDGLIYMLSDGIILIQVDIGGHSPITLGPTPLLLSVFSVSLIVAQFTIFSSSLGPELPELF
jgi:hypothetical protein